MSRIETKHTFSGKKISYEITGDGYMIYLDGAPWVHQYEPYIPYPDLGYEESCIKQVKEICSVEHSTEESNEAIL